MADYIINFVSKEDFENTLVTIKSDSFLANIVLGNKDML
jgi:hypothetical protein